MVVTENTPQLLSRFPSLSGSKDGRGVSAQVCHGVPILTGSDAEEKCL